MYFIGDKIHSATYNGQQLPQSLIRPMLNLNHQRNQLVHDPNYNAISDRQGFIRQYEQCKKELLALLKPADSRHHHNSGCIIC